MYAIICVKYEQRNRDWCTNNTVIINNENDDDDRYMKQNKNSFVVFSAVTWFICVEN